MVYEVVRPVGVLAAEVKSIAPRLDTLNNKTVCEAWNQLFRGDEVFPKIRALLRQRYPDIRIIPYEELPGIPIGPKLEEVLDTFGDTVLEKHCDALITGMVFFIFSKSYLLSLRVLIIFSS